LTDTNCCLFFLRKTKCFSWSFSLQIWTAKHFPLWESESQHWMNTVTQSHTQHQPQMLTSANLLGRCFKEPASNSSY